MRNVIPIRGLISLPTDSAARARRPSSAGGPFIPNCLHSQPQLSEQAGAVADHESPLSLVAAHLHLEDLA